MLDKLQSQFVFFGVFFHFLVGRHYYTLRLMILDSQDVVSGKSFFLDFIILLYWSVDIKVSLFSFYLLLSYFCHFMNLFLLNLCLLLFSDLKVKKKVLCLDFRHWPMILTKIKFFFFWDVILPNFQFYFQT